MLLPGMAESCVADVTGTSANCKAEDVRIGSITVVAGGTVDGCDFPGDTVTVDLRAELIAGATTRCDVGVFVRCRRSARGPR